MRSGWIPPQIRRLQMSKDMRLEALEFRPSGSRWLPPFFLWLRCLLHLDAGETDLLDVAVVGAAAAAQHSESRKLAAQRLVTAAEIDRVADVEIGRGIELGMTAHRRIGAKPA